MRSPIWFVVAGLIVVACFAGALFYLQPWLAAADAGMMRVVVRLFLNPALRLLRNSAEGGYQWLDEPSFSRQ